MELPGPESGASLDHREILSPDPASLARQFGPLISSLAYQFFGNHEDARDASQEAWLEVLASLPGFQGKSSLSTWIHTVAWRRILRLKKQEKLYSLPELQASYRVDELPAPRSDGPELRFWAEETCRRCMTGVLFCLNSQQRLAFLFRHTTPLSYADIAVILSTSVQNARKLHSRARALIGDFMNNNCAYAKPHATCRCGMERWIRTSQLDKAFERLGSFGSAVAAYKIHPRLLPGPNYWETYIGLPR